MNCLSILRLDKSMESMDKWRVWTNGRGHFFANLGGQLSIIWDLERNMNECCGDVYHECYTNANKNSRVNIYLCSVFKYSRI